MPLPLGSAAVALPSFVSSKVEIDVSRTLPARCGVAAVKAPEFRGAHRPGCRPELLRRILLAAVTLLAAGISSKADEFRPWPAETVPALALSQLDGPGIDLAEFRGTPVIVHFFATWCAPCIAEMASLNALAAARKGSPAILAISVGEVDARVRNFFRDRPVAFPILLDRDRSAMKTWQVEGLPTSFVLDRDLRPAFKAVEPLDWTSPSVVAALAALPATSPKSNRGEKETPP